MESEKLYHNVEIKLNMTNAEYENICRYFENVNFHYLKNSLIKNFDMYEAEASRVASCIIDLGEAIID